MVPSVVVDSGGGVLSGPNLSQFHVCYRLPNEVAKIMFSAVSVILFTTDDINGHHGSSRGVRDAPPSRSNYVFFSFNLHVVFRINYAK